MCGSTNAIFNYRLHKKMKEWLQIQEKDYRNMKKATETKKAGIFTNSCLNKLKIIDMRLLLTFCYNTKCYF